MRLVTVARHHGLAEVDLFQRPGEDCAEVASDGGVLVRDTTDRAGFMLSAPASAWTAFLAALR
jgi:hypothetical protein